VGVYVRGGAVLRVQEFLLRVGLLLGVELPGGGSIFQEVRPEDKMAADSQNANIITLSGKSCRACWEQ
jgi:hypothetical protein